MRFPLSPVIDVRRTLHPGACLKRACPWLRPLLPSGAVAAVENTAAASPILVCNEPARPSAMRNLIPHPKPGSSVGRDLSQQLQCNVLGYDYTGYGASTGACPLASVLV